MNVLHEPRLDTILMVEKTLLDSKEHQTKNKLWRSLPKQVQYQTFDRILQYLEASGRIVLDNKLIVYTGADNAKLRTLIKSSIRTD